MNHEHGSPYDRGSADSFYRRQAQAHYMINGARIEKVDMTAEQIAEYEASGSITVGGVELQAGDLKVRSGGGRPMDSGSRVQGSGSRVQGPGSRVQGPGFTSDVVQSCLWVPACALRLASHWDGV